MQVTGQFDAPPAVTSHPGGRICGPLHWILGARVGTDVNEPQLTFPTEMSSRADDDIIVMMALPSEMQVENYED